MMNSRLMNLTMLFFVFLSSECIATTHFQCDQTIFTEQEIKDWKPSRKNIAQLSILESKGLINEINSKARQISNSENRPCLSTSERCSGSDQMWSYDKKLITDAFDSVLGGNAEKSSTGFLQFEDEYNVRHRIYEGYTCSWSSNKVKCVQWCSHLMEDHSNNG